MEIDADGFVFSLTPDGSAYLQPNSISQRYAKLAARLGIRTSIHKLRHYSATELIAAGVDVRTVAGRLGHGGGGTTTLRTYAAWVSESDQRAASSLFARMPARPGAVNLPMATDDSLPPYLRIASALRAAIEAGDIPSGTILPGVKDIGATYSVSAGTAHRAISLLVKEGYVEVRPGRGTRVVWELAEGQPAEGDLPVVVRSEELPSATAEPARPTPTYFMVTLRGPDGRRFPPRLVPGDLADPAAFRAHLVGIARMEAPELTDDSDGWVGAFELEVARPEAAAGTPAMTLRW